MANSDAAQVSSLPLPPVQYINQYTEENVRRGRVPRPPPPPQDTYSMFGNAFGADDAIIRPLESQGIRRLYHQHCDRRKELRKLNHSLLVNFLDLLDLLVQCPDSPRRAEKVEDLSLLFIHVHHLLNEFRPHQARETLRVMLELQMRQRHETAQRFQRHLERAMETVHNALAALPEPVRAPDSDPLALAQDSGSGSSGEAAACDASARDRLMCAIVDAMP